MASTYASRLAASRVPKHLHEGLVEYFEKHRRPGDFLVAVMSNDLKTAWRLADNKSWAGLRELMKFLHWDAPSDSSGSPEKVEQWLALRQVTA